MTVINTGDEFLREPTEQESGAIQQGVADLFVTIGNVLTGRDPEAEALATQQAQALALKAKRRNQFIVGGLLLLVVGVGVYKFTRKG